MKLVIDTQHCENYAAHNGFTGEFRWKFKGGDTYVVRNLTHAQQERIERDGIPTLTALIESDSEAWREYIIRYNIVEDDAAEGEEWETPYVLSYEDGKWIATRFTSFESPYSFVRRGLKDKTERYEMLPQGDRTNYSCMYTLTDGRVLDHDAACKALTEMENA